MRFRIKISEISGARYVDGKKKLPDGSAEKLEEGWSWRSNNGGS